MKTVTDDFLTAQKRSDSKVVRVVEYKRRYWDAGESDFVWEDDWTELPSKYLSTVSPITWQLDNDILNEFKVSNVTLVLNNDLGYFNPQNNSGFFGKDDASPTYGYEPYWTKFRVRSGFILADNTEEVITLFTGVLGDDPIYESQTKTVQFTIQGLESTLLNTKAEEIATDVSLETIGTGNDSDTDFQTANPGVGAVSLVTVNSVEQVEGDDYSVSTLADPTQGATISFSTAPGSGLAIKATYYYWPQDLEFKEIVELLLDAAGVPSGNQNISSVVFENSILGSETYTSESDWEAGTISNLDSTTTPGDLLIDFLEQKESKTWGTSTSGWTSQAGAGGTLASDGTSLYDSAGSAVLAYRSSSSAVVGAWRVTWNGTASGKSGYKFACQNLGTTGPHGFINMPGYALVMDGTNALYLRRVDKDVITGNYADIGSYPIVESVPFTVDVVRVEGGRFLVYVNGTLRIDSTDNNYTVFDTVAVEFYNTNVHKLGGFYTPPSTITGSWTSDTLDMATTPSAWGNSVLSETADGATILHEARTSSDGMSFDSWLPFSGSMPTSDFHRYIQLRATISFSSSTERTPSIQEIEFNWVATGAPIILPALDGLNVYEAIQHLGEYANYEFGFDADENFFFRSRTTDASVMSLNQSNFIAKIYGMDLGYNRLYSIVRATYGDITKEAVDATVSPTNSTYIVGARRFEITPDSNIQIDSSLDIATGVAAGLLSYFSSARKRFKMTTKFLPQLDLSDAVTVSLVTDTPNKIWYWGDKNVAWGDKDIFYWNGDMQLANDLTVKIIGIRYDTEQHNVEFDVEEVLS